MYICKKSTPMKKSILILWMLLILIGCGKSNEEKLNELIAEKTKSTLFIPESYDPVSLECDSISRNIISDVNIKKSAKIIEKMKEAKRYQREMDSNAEERDYWQGKYGEFYSDYSRKFAQAKEKRDKVISEADILFQELLNDYSAEPEFCGYIVNLRFRAKNNAGNVLFGEYVFILDKEMSNILAVYDATTDDFLGFFQMVGRMQEITQDEQEEYDLGEICDNIKTAFELQYSVH